ncbi:MAG: hypothetical protein LBH28_06195 [Oscillospiraceae bacterium]|jgi:hypothetical protein|nr:hypothetical protein [Oscillospiraceae bacterium]
MPHEYTRQRQGRDFTMHEALFGAFARCLAAFDRIKETIAVKPDFS